MEVGFGHHHMGAFGFPRIKRCESIGWHFVPSDDEPQARHRCRHATACGHDAQASVLTAINIVRR